MDHAPSEARAAGDGWYRLPFVPQRWGVRSVGTIEVTLHDRWRLDEARLTISVPPIMCHPRPAALDSLVVLSKLPARLGEHASRRPARASSSPACASSCPATGSGGSTGRPPPGAARLQLNIFTAERAQVTVLLMDVSTDVGEPGESSADLAVRAATGTAIRYLAARDRVGLISFGRQLHWIAPAAGRRQADRILDLITTKSVSGHPLQVVSELPRAALPPGALVIVFSPLLSLRLVEALRELRERGFATIVVDVLRVPQTPGLDQDEGAG